MCDYVKVYVVLYLHCMSGSMVLYRSLYLSSLCCKSLILCDICAAGAAPNMMSTQYYGMPGATPPSWGVYPAQNALMSGQQTPGTPGTPQPAMIRSQPARSATPHQQQDAMTGPGPLTPAALHTPGQLPSLQLSALYS